MALSHLVNVNVMWLMVGTAECSVRLVSLIPVHFIAVIGK